MEVVNADVNPFLADIAIVKSIFYSPRTGPITLTKDDEEASIESCNLTHREFKWNLQSIQVDSWPMIQLINGP